MTITGQVVFLIPYTQLFYKGGSRTLILELHGKLQYLLPGPSAMKRLESNPGLSSRLPSPHFGLAGSGKPEEHPRPASCSQQASAREEQDCTCTNHLRAGGVAETIEAEHLGTEDRGEVRRGDGEEVGGEVRNEEGHDVTELKGEHVKKERAVSWNQLEKLHGDTNQKALGFAKGSLFGTQKGQHHFSHQVLTEPRSRTVGWGVRRREGMKPVLHDM